MTLITLGILAYLALAIAASKRLKRQASLHPAEQRRAALTRVSESRMNGRKR